MTKYIQTHCEYYRGWTIYATFEPRLEIENLGLGIKKHEIEIPPYILEKRQEKGYSDYHIDWIKEKIDKNMKTAYFIYLPPDKKAEIPASWVNVNLIKEVEEHPNMITIKFGYQEFGGIEVAYTGERMKLFKKEFTEFMKQQSQ